MTKKKVFCLLLPFYLIDQYTTQKKFLIEKISESFDKFYIINCSWLELGRKREIESIEKIKNKIPKNCEIHNPKNSKEFIKFSEDKNLIILCNLGRLWRFYKVHYLLKKVDAKLVYSHEIGNSNFTTYPSFRSYISQLLLHHLPHKLVIILSILNIFPKVELRFLTNKKHYLKATNNFFFKLSKKQNLFTIFYTKNFELINSASYDINLSNKLKKSEDKIVMVDTKINHHDNVTYTGGISEKDVEKCYKTLEIFLNNLSKTYRKPVTVCIHPSENLTKIQNFLKDFEVVKHQTKENIYKSFITLFYESSAIVDAILLKKKIIALENSMMGRGWIQSSNHYHKKTGIMKINIEHEFNIPDKELFLKKLDDLTKTEKFNNFIVNFLQSDGNESGTMKVIKTIQKRFFD